EMPARGSSYRFAFVIAAGLLCAGILAGAIYYLTRDREPSAVVKRPEPKPTPEEKKVPPSRESKPVTPEPPDPKAGPLGMTFVKVPGGVFWMSRDRVNAQREEAIKEDFYLAQHSVTQGQWQSVMGNNPSMYSREGKARSIVADIADGELS